MPVVCGQWRGVPAPRRTLPGRAPVILPSAMTGTPFTSTYSIALRELVRLLEGGEVANGCGIEDDDVGPHALFEDAAIGEAHALSGQGAELADGILQSERVLLADILAQDAREGAVGARVRMLLAEQASGAVPCESLSIDDPGLLRAPAATSGSCHAEHGHRGVGLVSYQEVEEGIDGIFVPHYGDLGEASYPEAAGASGFCTTAIRIASGPGMSCHSLSQSDFGLSMSLRIRARVAGSLRRSISFASPPSCAQGGMKAEKRVEPRACRRRCRR